MIRTLTRTSAVFLALLLAACGYRFVDPSPGGDYALTEVRNITSEPGLDRILTEGLHDLGTFNPRAKNRLTVIVTRFTEIVGSVSSSGKTIRERLKLEVEWKVQGADDSEAIFGKAAVTRTYPYSEDPVTLDWNRSAAIRLLANAAAEKVLDGLGGLP